MSSGVVGNADRWTATFVDSEGVPIDPDGPVTWTVTPTKGEPTEIVQELGSAGHQGVGTFELVYVPEERGGYKVKAEANVQGVPQATPAVKRQVVG